MAKVTLKGIGQLNGPVVINKTLEFDTKQAQNFTGLKRDEVVLATLQIYFPGVKVNPRQIGINVIY